MAGHTVVSMTWVWQELSDEGISRRALELLKDLMASVWTGLLRGVQYVVLHLFLLAHWPSPVG